jgi:uncharacterized RDD family membrane protein YckC
MTTKWYVKRNSAVSGPFEATKIREAIASGKIRRSDMLAETQTGPFLSLEEFESLTTQGLAQQGNLDFNTSQPQLRNTTRSGPQEFDFFNDASPPTAFPPAGSPHSSPVRNDGGQWYYSFGGQQYGPVPLDAISQFAAAGRLSPNDLVWQQGMPEWVPLSQLAGVLPRSAPAPHQFPPQTHPQTYSPNPYAAPARAAYAASSMQGGHSPQYAGFGARFLAALIDGLISQAIWLVAVLLLSIVLGVIIGVIGPPSPDKEAGIALFFQLILQFTGAAIGWLYYAGMESSSAQATLGKKALGLKVTDLDGNRITLMRATGRHFGKIVSGFIFLIGFIMAAFTEKKQALHDIMAGCLVVKK